MSTLEIETAVFAETNLAHIAGLDEAGRGAWAGPVVAAAVILPLQDPDCAHILHQVTDSKQLKAALRESLYTIIIEYAVTYGVGSCSAQMIDQMGIVPATKQAMMLALAQLKPAADYLLIDGRIRLQQTPLPQRAIIRGDSYSLSIAAASILAKVTRDRHMIDLDAQYPHYHFGQHKGYGTSQHQAAIARYGATPVHRHTFAPLREKLL